MNEDMKLKLCVLISCMNQDESIIQRTNIQTDVVVVNQCDEDNVRDWDFVNKKGKKCHAKFICSKERGLSRSRNMAISNAIGDICLICDDDEWLEDDIEDAITSAYAKHTEASVVTFAFNRSDKSYANKSYPLGIGGIIRTSSVEISFKRKDIVEAGIEFDIMMGSGTGNGAGEENKFLMDCHRKNLKLVYEPIVIAKLLSTESMWFHGYEPAYFRNWGWATRRAMGTSVGFLYMLYALTFHHKLYSSNISFIEASRNMISGYFEKR